MGFVDEMIGTRFLIRIKRKEGHKGSQCLLSLLMLMEVAIGFGLIKGLLFGKR